VQATFGPTIYYLLREEQCSDPTIHFGASAPCGASAPYDEASTKTVSTPASATLYYVY
jgi:hypothetical protein